jgi:hypothetical protein
MKFKLIKLNLHTTKQKITFVLIVVFILFFFLTVIGKISSILFWLIAGLLYLYNKFYLDKTNK